MSSLMVMTVLIFLWLPNRILAQMPETHITLEEILFDVEWSSKGSVLAVAGEKGISLFTPDLKQIFHSQKYENVYSISWNPTGTQLASGARDGTIKVWNFNADQNTLTLFKTIPLNEANRFYSFVIWSPDGSKLASMMLSQPEGYFGVLGAIKIWNTVDWEVQTTFSDEIVLPLLNLVWNDDSTLFAGAGNICDPDVFGPCGNSFGYIADPATKKIHKITEDNTNITSLSWTSKGDVVFAGSTIVVYDALSDQLKQNWDIDGELFILPTYLSWDENNKNLAAGNDEGLIAIMDGFTGNIKSTLNVPTLRDLDWSPDGKSLVAIGGQTITILNISE
jgi:WD40 repeat protein